MMGDRDFFLGHIGDFEDNECSPKDAARMQELLKSDAMKELEAQFQEARGQLQIQLQGYYIGAERMQGLYDLVETPELRKTHEIERIDKEEKSEFWSNLRRRAVVAVLVVGVVGTVVYYWSAPKKVSTFRPIRHLALETISMIEDGRKMDYHISYPDSDLSEELAEDMPEVANAPVDQAEALAEVQEDLDQNPLLEFDAKIARLDDGDWRILGASVFDYDGTMVAVVRYESNDSLRESLFQYIFPGSIEKLPQADIGVVKEGGKALSYQAYGSDMLNLIAWQQADGVLSLVVGSRAVSELARLAARTP